MMCKPICQQLFMWGLFVFILSSCATSKKIIYFQNEQVGVEQKIEKGKYITIQPQDQLSIIVSSKDPELAAVFNLPRATISVGAQQGGLTNQNGQVLGYTVSDNGEIDFPILGALRIQGLTRQQVATLIKNKLSESLVKDAVITVDFINLNFSVMGEVVRPGKYAINKDQITILEALSMAGDLTIFGQRDKVFLIRTGDSRITYQLDLRSTDIFNSPAYYVQQNDVIYIEPNGVRANQSTVNGNTGRTVSLWISIASFLTTLGILIFN